MYYDFKNSKQGPTSLGRIRSDAWVPVPMYWGQFQVVSLAPETTSLGQFR